MSRFHTALDEAISKKFRKLVIIHGVGQGTLKMQIRKELAEKYPEYLFQDASFREYGFGATMIHLVTDKKQ
jgi:dsDNA-specific endonuclease/ATPase MutS2